MSFDLNALKNAFANNGGNNENSNSDRWNKFYPFWKMNFGEQAVFRFIKDANDENPLGFLVENVTHKIQVNGKTRVIPCLSMYDKPCPCCALSQKYYAEEGDNSANGRKYWKKREYLGAGIVRNSPFEVETGLDEVKIVGLGPKLFNVIQNAFASGDLENPPFFEQGGHDFRIKKSQQGEYADYSLSSFAPRPSDLTEDELALIDYLDLSTFRTKEITAEEMEALLVAAETGGTYEGNGAQSAQTQKPANAAVADLAASLNKATQDAPAPTQTETVQETSDESAGSSDMDAIVAQIRARANA